MDIREQESENQESGRNDLQEEKTQQNKAEIQEAGEAFSQKNMSAGEENTVQQSEPAGKGSRKPDNSSRQTADDGRETLSAASCTAASGKGFTEYADPGSKKVAVITGASSGLGREYCRYLDEKNEKFGLDELWIIARRRERLQELADSLKIPCRIFSLDLSEESSIQVLEKELEKENPDVKFLITAAGFGKMGNYQSISRQEYDKMLLINCKGMMDVTLVCLPYMHRNARILEVASVAAFQPMTQFNVYAASKAFVSSYSRALRWELFPRHINLTCVCPYWIKDTEFIQTTREDTDRPTAIRHFPFASTARHVVVQSMAHNRAWLPFSVPGVFAPIYRIWTKFAPHELALLVWEGWRRI